MQSQFIAFHGNVDLKSRLEKRLVDHIAAGELDFGTEWDGKTGRPTGCIVHAASLAVFEEQTGYPSALGGFLNLMHGHLRHDDSPDNRAKAHAFAVQWLARTPVGADLSGVSGLLVIKALQRQQRIDAAFLETSPTMASLLQKMIDLHGKAARGSMPSRAEWTAVRNEAIAATDAATGSMAKTVGALIEAVCWNPQASRSFLVDMAKSWAQVNYSRVLLASGWTDADQTVADALLQRLWEEFTAQREASEYVNYRELFGERKPELAKRYADQIDVGAAGWNEAMSDLADITLQTLQAAPVSAVVLV